MSKLTTPAPVGADENRLASGDDRMDVAAMMESLRLLAIQTTKLGHPINDLREITLKRRDRDPEKRVQYEASAVLKIRLKASSTVGSV